MNATETYVATVRQVHEDFRELDRDALAILMCVAKLGRPTQTEIAAQAGIPDYSIVS